MFRALLEILFTIVAVIVARAVLSSVLKSMAKASLGAFQNRQPNAGPDQRRAEPQAPTAPGGDLHKDPVCGTYVAESTSLKRRVAGQSFFYCSEECRDKHATAVK